MLPCCLVAGGGELSWPCCGTGVWVTAPHWQSLTLPKSALGGCLQEEKCSARTGFGAGLRLPRPSRMAMALPGGNRSRAQKKWGKRQPPAHQLIPCSQGRGCSAPAVPSLSPAGPGVAEGWGCSPGDVCVPPQDGSSGVLEGQRCPGLCRLLCTQARLAAASSTAAWGWLAQNKGFGGDGDAVALGDRGVWR